MECDDKTAGPADRPPAFYITSHGYGHGVRACDILRAFRRMAPRAPITVVTELPGAFLESRLEGVEVRRRAASFDVGSEQLDSIRHDVDASQARLRGLLDVWDGLVRQETDCIRRAGFSVVAADIPAIPLEAARAAGVPGIACGNFSWDWIYRHQNGHVIDRTWMSYPDVLASADMVVSKPGFGIVSECVANRRPLVCTGRGEFAEYPVLVDAIGRYLKNTFISPEDLCSGNLGPALEAVLGSPEPPERMEGGGDEAAARRLLEFHVSGSMFQV